MNLKWLTAQPPLTPITNPPDLSTKTALITGANQGLGFSTARHLLLLNLSTLILAVRDPSKGSSARETLLADPVIQAQNPHATIEVLRVDMADYSSVIAFADEVTARFPLLHILLLNAGCGQLHFEIAKATGHEKVVQVNYLSNALLALKLLPLLRATAAKTGVPSRLSIVGSRNLHGNSIFKKRPLGKEERVLEYMDDPRRYSGMTVYGNTKILVALFVDALAQRVPSQEIVVNNMCPGQVNTRMSDVLPFPLRQIIDVVKALRARTPEEGAWVIVNAVVVVGEESHGRFLKDMVAENLSEFTLSLQGKEIQRKLLKETLEEMKKVDPSTIGAITA